MAEALSSTEIEDVLSSIRRLVAQDLKPADRAKLAAVADISKKLVLTPENRIEDRAEAEYDPPKFMTVRRPTRRAAFPEIDDVLPNMDAPEDAMQEGTRSDWSLGADLEFTAPQPIEFTGETKMSDIAPEEFAYRNFEVAVDQSEQTAVEGFVFNGPRADIAESPSADLADDIAEVPSADLADDIAEVPGDDLADDIAEAAQIAAQEDWNDEPEDIDESSFFSTPEQSFQGTIEPDEDWANDAEARVIAELTGDAVEETITQSAGRAARNVMPEFLYDEELLRNMIQTIFREELSGPLGERMTRNIRKLVRAEVGRLLAAQDLE